MAPIYRYRMTWSGPQGLPGKSTLYADGTVSTAQVFANDVSGLFSDIFTLATTHSYLPAGITLQGEDVVDILESASGLQTGQTPVTPVAGFVGASSLRYSAVSGMSITWNTNNFALGHRLRGRTYFVPLAGECYQASNGTLDDGFVTTVRNAITQYISKPSAPVVWHRPSAAGASDGLSDLITGGSIQDHQSVLHSRMR